MESPRYESLALPSVDEPSAPSRVSIDPDRVAALADDIAAHGLLQPIGVAGPDERGRYALGFGHRRLLAHRLLERPTIDARVWPAGTSLVVIRASENHMREQLTPIEEALELQRFVDNGRSHAELARLYRRSVAWVAERLDLLTLPDELQDAVQRGDLPLGVANLLRTIDHDDYRASLVREAVERGASIATVRVWCAHYEADRQRIVQNHESVEQIVQARGAYIVKYRCEGCQTEVPIEETGAFRFCRGCAKSITLALRTESNGHV